MSIFSLCAFCIISVIIAVLLKQNSPVFSLVVVVFAGVLLLAFILSDIKYFILDIKNIINLSNIDNKYFTVALKALGICYLTQFTGEICNDFGQTSIASKVDLAGKLLILTLTLPLIKDVINITLELLK